MRSSIVVKGIELSGQCGVTESERCQPQPLLVDIIFECPHQSAFQSDQLLDTVDYAAVTDCIKVTGTSRPFSLLETLAEHLCQTLFQQFPITNLKIWVRKIRPPLQGIQGSVGVRLARSRSQPPTLPYEQPAPFLVDLLSRLPRKGHVLDLAMGKGRNSLYLASQGYTVHGIDRDPDALQFCQVQAQRAGLTTMTTECLDLEPASSVAPDLGSAAYDVILVFFYLFRPLLPRVLQALKPGGMVVYETFLLENHIRRNHPRRKEFCLAPNELLTLLPGMTILHYDEGEHQGWAGETAAFSARLVAQNL